MTLRHPFVPLAALLLLLGASTVASTFAQDPENPSPRRFCTKCKQTGWLPCPGRQHDERKHCGFVFPHRCVGMCTATCCHGIQKVPCQDCKDPECLAEFENEKASRLAWAESIQKLDTELALPLSHVETENFVVHSSILEWKVKETTYARTKIAHLFATRLEAVAKRFKEVTGMLPSTKQTFYLVPNQADNQRVTLIKMGGEHATTFRLNSSACVVCTWPNPINDLGRDELFHAHVVHLGAHTLIQAAYGFQLKLPAWFDEGFAEWLEIDTFKSCRTFCFNEVNAKDPWETADWMKKIYGEVTGGKEVSFAGVVPMILDKMRYRDLAYCWSYIDYLIRSDPERFKKFFERMKRTIDTKKSLEETYEVSTATFQERWRAWVLKNYGGK